MLVLSFALLSLAVLSGGGVFAGVLPRAALVHGTLGAAGVACLVLAWRHAALSGVVARDALVLVSAGLCGGLVIGLLKWRGRPAPGLLLFLHATAGGLAYLLLAGFVLGHG